MSRVIVSEFDGTMKTPLRLVDSATTTKGVLILTYEPAGTDAER